MLAKCMRNSMGKNGHGSIRKKYAKCAMLEFKELLNCWIIFDFQAQSKGTIGSGRWFMSI